MHRLSAVWSFGVLLAAAAANGQVSGTYARGYFTPDPMQGDTARPDRIAVTNAGTNRILSFGMYLSRGADADGDGIGLFFDTTAPSAETPPAGGEALPGYGGAARLRIEPASASLVGYVASSELFVPYPGTQLGPDGDGAVQLVTITCDHFDPGETVRLGIDVDGFDDFLGAPLGEDPPAAGLTIAAGQCVVDGVGQVYFDIVSGDAPDPVAVPLRVPWLPLGCALLAIGFASKPRFW